MGMLSQLTTLLYLEGKYELCSFRADPSKVSLGSPPPPNTAHFQLEFEVFSHLELDEFVIVCVMNILTGGGGHLVAGSLARGSFARLFISVLNKNRGVNCCAAHSASHQDTGLLYAQPSSSPENIKSLASRVPLSQPIPGLPKVIYPTPSSSKNLETKVTVMKNGLKVASEKKFGQYCIAGVAINSGSRLEEAYPNGISHFIERSAFRCTSKFHGREHILEHLSSVGGTLDCQGSRDLIIYAVSVINEHLETAVDLLSEAVLRPQLQDHEVEETASRIAFELQDMAYDPERKTQLAEMVHAAAYGNETLGLPKICPEENLDKITPGLMFNYLRHNFSPDRMVLAAVGVEHDKLVELAEKYFVDKQPIWLENPSLACEHPQKVERSKAIYVGGMNAIEADLSNVSLGPTPLPNLAHFQLGFEVCSHLELDEFVIVCVMNMLMGGGGSFSAGGPGKGMFTRLFTSVLNRYHWVNSCAAHNASYEDTGLFYIQSSASPENLKSLVDVVIHEFRDLAYGPMFRDELARAKKQLISMLWLNLEVRPIVFEDIARQVLVTGFRRQPKQLIEKIESVTEDDIKKVARKMLKKTPTVCCLGDLRKLPSYDYIRNELIGK